MKKPYIIIHMMTSIDGKIDGEYMEQKNSIYAGNYYDDQINELGSSMALGRVTVQKYHAGEISLDDIKDLSPLPLKDHILKKDHYLFVFDRNGRCSWKNNEFIYNNISYHIVEVVSSKVNPLYLAYLENKNISYMISGSLLETLNKIGKLDINYLVVTGGAILNGGFLKEHLVDEISLVIAPYIDGNPLNQASFDGVSNFVMNQDFKFNFAHPLKDGGVHLSFIKK